MTQDEREVETRLHLVENQATPEEMDMQTEFLQKISEMEEFLIEVQDNSIEIQNNDSIT